MSLFQLCKAIFDFPVEEYFVLDQYKKAYLILTHFLVTVQCEKFGN